MAGGYDYELETCSNHWQFWRCLTCSAVWLDPRPHQSALGTIYPAHYYSYDMSGTLSPLVLWGKAKLDDWKFKGILQALGHKPASYLDVGCGDGRYLRYMRELSLGIDNIYGIELSSTLAARLREEGFKVFDKRVEDCREIAAESLDLITMFHVIEHVEKPVDVLRRLAGWLSKDGMLVLETPSTESIDARWFSRTWWGGYHIPRHWTLFNPKSIDVAINLAGLGKIGVLFRTGHSFWLYSLHNLAKFNSVIQLPRLAKLFDPMNSVLGLIGVTLFDLIRSALGFKTSSMLVLARPKHPHPSPTAGEL